ncbi:thiol reductant ABC exporter subunit CydD [Methylobacter sp.]|uniref:thiol reductant ABC exporter subunit CydD n=1 Tax=Methylobacter sp. TaxID=2051955 RepID=UPI00248966CE|nr:thiol reductant ABC exporter subunit CydD [Methylobacter sp.]MDI1279582.1 thiol reductant ABC exporter subunit CydD [Methylobacter sp.]MDI1360309.1 thiol reductant ABC exporter subunit CydD [Methylobacter sp.]
MRLTETDNQAYFDKNKAREKTCAVWLKQQSKAVRKPILFAAIAGITNGLGVIVQSAALAYLLQAVIIDKLPWASMITPFMVLAAVFILRSVCVYWHQTAGFEAGAQVRASVRQQLLDKFLTLGPAAIKQRQSGELAAVTLEQVDALENYFSRYLPQQMIVGVLPIIMIIAVMPVNWVVGLIFLVTGPLVPVFMALVGMGAASANRSQFLAMSRMSGYFLDRLQGLATLKLFGQATQELANISKIADGFREKTMAVLRIAFLSSAVLEFFSAIAVALVAVYVGLGLLGLAHFGPAEHISLSEALFVLLLAPEFFMPLRQLAINYHDRAAALGATDAILTILEQDADAGTLVPKLQLGNPEGEAPASRDGKLELPSPSSQAGAWELANLIEFNNVGKSYDKRQVLADINLNIAAGEKVALVGESGAGKTTLLNLLLGFEAPTEGQVLLNGQTVNRECAAKAIAWVGQSAYIFHGTIKDNIALADPDASEQSIANASEAAGVTEFSAQLPDGLLTPIGERGYGLSGGQVQRIALARAFLKNADIILLDEPTANLDAANKTLLLDVIDRLFADKTLIIASHDPDVIQRMGRRVELQQGRLVS